MNFASNPRVTNAAQTIGSCKASMRRLQYDKIISHLSFERSVIYANNKRDDEDLNHKPKACTGVSPGKAAIEGNRKLRRRRGTKGKYAKADPTQEERDQRSSTPIITNTTESETELQPLNELPQILNNDKKLTIYATDEIMQPHLSHLSLENSNWKTEKLCPPANLEVSECFHPQSYPTPQAEEGLPNKAFVREENETKKEARNAVNHGAME